jgi:tRNA pseudouridine synthase 10
MKRKIPEEIFDEIIQAVEEKEAQKQIFMNLQISVQDTLKREDGTKEYLKKEFLNKYGRPVSTEYLSTVEVVLEKDQTDIRIVNESIFICGRYRKNKRGISNTPMLPTNRHPIRRAGHAKNKHTPEERMPAVSDWVEPLRNYFQGDKIVFMSGGREDYDVRMLGNGRPFLCRIENPFVNLPRKVGALSTVVSEEGKAVEEYSEVHKPIEIPYGMSPAVELVGLSLVDGARAMKDMKKIEEEHCKVYGVRVLTKLPREKVEDSISSSLWEEKEGYYSLKSTNLLLRQKTPIRVLHRRSNLVRDKILHSCRILVDQEGNNGETILQIEIKSSSGTYIKEFINGDMGRTVPSLSEIVEGYCDVLELDVLEIEDAFPDREYVLAPVNLMPSTELPNME